MPRLKPAVRLALINDIRAGGDLLALAAKYNVALKTVKAFKRIAAKEQPAQAPEAPPTPDTTDSEIESIISQAPAGGAPPPKAQPEPSPTEKVDKVHQVPVEAIEKLLNIIPDKIVRGATLAASMAYKVPSDNADIKGLAELTPQERESIAFTAPFVAEHAATLSQYIGPIAIAAYFGTIIIGTAARIYLVAQVGKHLRREASQPRGGGGVDRPAGDGKDVPRPSVPGPSDPVMQLASTGPNN